VERRSKYLFRLTRRNKFFQNNGSVGWFPSNYVDETDVAPTPATFSTQITNHPEPAQIVNYPNQFNNECERILEIVIAMYNFDAQNAEELSFRKGEKLDIIDHPPHDPDWFKARNSHGQIGLVPTNYIEIIDRNPTSSAFDSNSNALKPTGTNQPPLSGPYANEPWYFGIISREQSDVELNSRGTEGDFLVRDSESNPGDYSISLKGNIRNKHFWVQVDTNTGSYKIGNRNFPSMQSLIQHYMKSPIFSNDATGERLYLIKPLARY